MRKVKNMTYAVPEFPTGYVPVKVVATLMKKSEIYVRECIRDGSLPIGIIKREGNRSNVYISPMKLWQETGIIWDGREEDKQ